MAGRHWQLDGRALKAGMEIQVENLTKRFGSTVVLDHIELKIAEGEFLGLLGPSGSGKTTLLRVLAGLDWPEQGRVLFDGADILDVPLEQRPVGLVFQHYALFPHMRVFDNVAFGLEVLPRRRRPPKKEITDRVDRLLELVQLEGLADRFPGQLSGGQRQRVALARSIAARPGVILLDEPFGALDAISRAELQQAFDDLRRALSVTTLLVTHDLAEAARLADEVVVMRKGRIEQRGSMRNLVHAPATEYVAQLIERARAGLEALVS